MPFPDHVVKGTGADHLRRLEQLVSLGISAAGIQGPLVFPDLPNHPAGEVTADAIVDWFSIENNYSLVTELLGAGISPKISLILGEQLKGMVFVITGGVEFAPNRDVLAKVIKAHGGKVSGSVSKDTTALICNYPSSSSKATEAEKLNVPVWTERYLLSKLTNEIDIDQLLKSIK